jgi:iron complex transport system ATP-binding protein
MVSRLEIETVSFRHHGADDTTLDGVDLGVAPGETLALLGPNGSGKSTLLRIAAGLLRPHRGRALVDGIDVASLRPRDRARAIAVVPQQMESWPNVAVRDFVLSGRYAHRRPWSAPGRTDHEAADRALVSTGLGTLGERALPSLSGGERQRALVARALAQDPRLLLCDEPTASLDVDQQLGILERIAAAAREDRSVLLVTHDLNLAAQFGDRIALLVDGRVMAAGSADEILRHDVLKPVYGDQLHFDRLPGTGRPLVVPKRSPGAPRSAMIDGP